jgi:hypothetical protein
VHALAHSIPRSRHVVPHCSAVRCKRRLLLHRRRSKPNLPCCAVYDTWHAARCMTPGMLLAVHRTARTGFGLRVVRAVEKGVPAGPSVGRLTPVLTRTHRLARWPPHLFNVMHFAASALRRTGPTSAQDWRCMRVLAPARSASDGTGRASYSGWMPHAGMCVRFAIRIVHWPDRQARF